MSFVSKAIQMIMEQNIMMLVLTFHVAEVIMRGQTTLRSTKDLHVVRLTTKQL